MSDVRVGMRRSLLSEGYDVTVATSIPVLSHYSDRFMVDSLKRAFGELSVSLAAIGVQLLMERVAASYALCSYVGRLHRRAR